MVAGARFAKPTMSPAAAPRTAQVLFQLLLTLLLTSSASANLCESTTDCSACSDHQCPASCYARACASADASCGGSGLIWAISDRGDSCTSAWGRYY